MSLILTQLYDDIGTIIMNNPEHRNVLSSRMVDEILLALEALIKGKARVIILRAFNGAKTWSAGHDVNELPLPGRDPLAYSDPLVTVLRSLTMTPAKIGVPYNATGILHFLGVMGINIAKEMFFSAQPLSAERAENLGIVNHLVPQEDLERFTYELAGKITRNSPLSIKVIKEQIRLLSHAHPLSPHTFERVQGLRRIVYDSRDYAEGINAFHEKRPPSFQGE